MLDGEDKIIEDAIQGEASAFGALYDHYQPRLYRFVFLRVATREEAEDLTHQIFLNAWQNIASYEHRGFPFSSWLYGIARNLVIDHYRSKKQTEPLEDIDEGALEGLADIEEDTEARLALLRVMKAIRALSSIEQDVLIMRFVEDLPVREVALAVGKSEGAVKLIQHRALKELKNILE